MVGTASTTVSTLVIVVSTSITIIPTIIPTITSFAISSLAIITFFCSIGKGDVELKIS